MALVYADHPFPLIQTPVFLAKSKDPNAQPDKFTTLASEMAQVHNLLLRGLNSIYLQAPHIPPADHKPFCRYILAWHAFLHAHHGGEETSFFPTVEKMAGVEGLMGVNVEQHRVFHDGVEGLRGYVEGVLAGREGYDGGKGVEFVDRFGAALARHLEEEIGTILGLREYDEGGRMEGLARAFEVEADKTVREIGTAGMVWFFANLDVHYENDLWLSWPPAPGPVKVLIRSLFWWMYADVRKFGSVDRVGKLRPLAVPEAGAKSP